MKPTLILVLLVLALNAPAQDIEPTLERAVASLANELVAELPYRMPNGEALAIEMAPSADRKVVEALVARLLEEGLRIEAGGPQPERSEGGGVGAASSHPTGAVPRVGPSRGHSLSQLTS